MQKCFVQFLKSLSLSRHYSLQDYKSNQEGTLASYRLPSSGEMFKVSLYPIQEVNKMDIQEATKISYIQSDKGIYVVSVSGNISTDKKNQILQKVNLFADKLNWNIWQKINYFC